MECALFTKTFLEPTHYAIGLLAGALHDCHFTVFARRYLPGWEFLDSRIRSRTTCTATDIPPLKTLGLDIVHVIFDGPFSLAAAAAARDAAIPYILSFHGGFDTHVTIHREGMARALPQALSEAAAITVVSTRDVIRLAALGYRGRTEHLTVPIDLSLVPGRRERAGHLIAVARLIEKKGIDCAVQALSLLPQSYRLTVVGHGEMEPELRLLADRLSVSSRVTFAGLLPLHQTLDLLASAEIFLYPAREAANGDADGTPQALLWAQACCVPVVSGVAGSIPDIVRHRRTGLLVPPNDAEALAAAVRQLRYEPLLKERLVRAARTRIERRHSLDRIAGRLRELYVDVRDLG